MNVLYTLNFIEKVGTWRQIMSELVNGTQRPLKKKKAMKESFSRATSGGRVVRHSINEENVRGGVWNRLPAKYCGDFDKETKILWLL